MAGKKSGFEQLFVEELQDVYDAERQLVKALPKIAKAASDEQLREALTEHLEVTKGQVERLEQIFESMEMRARSRPCRGMKGIVEEGQEVIRQEEDEMLVDAAITGSARKVEHYEMAAYEGLRSLAQQLGLKDAAELLKETLQEEIQADRQLAQLGKRILKESSSRAQQAQRGRPGQGAGRAVRGSSRGRRSSGGSAAHL
jgi:ferritin-like metal-binding protein YciE